MEYSKLEKTDIEKISMLEKEIEARDIELYNRNRKLQRLNDDILEMLIDVIEYRDSISGGHVKRVKAYTAILASHVMRDYPEYELTQNDVNRLSSMAPIHDIGKIVVPDHILKKEGKLTPEEFEIMKQHTVKGVELLRNAPRDWDNEILQIGRDVCHYHHERWDGNGYPEGLKGDEIPISAQIVSVADCFDALTEKRQYKDAMPLEKAYNLILDGACGIFSPKLIKCFLDCRDEFAEIILEGEQSKGNERSQLPVAETLKNMKILLVDDNDMILDINQDILESEGANVITAENGSEAIEIYKMTPDLDAVLIDIIMPVMNGIEATAKIREMEKGSNVRIPIVALTADKATKLAEECIKAGADDCMEKPLAVSVLAKIIIDCLRARSLNIEKQLEETIKIAHTDMLTGVKNITAYTDMVAEITNKLSKNSNFRFSVLMVDIDNLKYINDMFGHNSGDVYIRNCCNIICDIFAQSPIYRIGGDEFAIIIQGVDYANREGLLAKLEEERNKSALIESVEKGRTSFSYGIADYNPELDFQVSDVMKRADSEMYLYKEANRVRYR